MTIVIDMKDDEKKAMDELKKRMKDDMDPKLYEDNHLFLKFLKARDMNVDNAETMLRKHLEWRKKYDIENILKYKKTEVQEKYVSNVILGFDKEGCVVRYFPVGNLDMPGVIASSTHEEMIKLILYETETETEELRKQTKKLGKIVEKAVYIHNLENFSFAQATDKKMVQFGIFMMSTYVSNYPERLKAAFLINVPVYFSLFYNIMKTFVPAAILQKIRLYSDDSYKEDILKMIDADVVPKFLGGNRTDPDGNPLCVSLIYHGGEKVPNSYYISKNRQPLSKLPGVEKLTLSNASFNEVKLEVKEPGSYLEWEFETKNRDIGFGVFYEEMVDGEEKITELIPIERIDTEEYPETGTYICEKAGKYVIVFDNTYSWVRGKEIYYRTKVVTPKEHEAELKED